MEKEDLQLKKLKNRLPDVDETTLKSLLEDSKYIALNNLFPFEDMLPDELPPKYLNWQLRVSEYMYKHRDMLGIESYSENGMNIKFFSDNVPKSFMNELVPYAGSINRKFK